MARTATANGNTWRTTQTAPNQTMPQNSFSCAICHLQAGQGKDWVFRAALHFDNANGAVPTGIIKDYTFVTGALHVKAGSTITFYNDDVVAHTIADNDPTGFVSSPIPAGSSIQLRFPNVPFEWDYHCSIHPAMKGKIIIDPQSELRQLTSCKTGNISGKQPTVIQLVVFC